MSEQERKNVQNIMQETVNLLLTKFQVDALVQLLDKSTILGKDAEAVVTLKMKFKDALK